VSVFPVPFGVPALACCVILSPLKDFSSPHGRPTKPIGLDLNGIATFRRYETRSGWASPLSRGGGVLPTSRASPVGACRFPAASPSPSLPQPVCEGSSDETSTEIHTINPSDLSLARGPRTEREPFGVSPGLRTPPLPATHAKVGTGLTDTDPELHPRHQSNLQTVSPLTTCDLASHCPLYSGATVLTQPTKTHQLPLPLLHGQPCTPVLLLSSGAPSNEASSGVHSFTHPPFPSPVVSGQDKDPWAFPLGSAPHSYP
jgi:hypothetical protein